ncbi:MAG TPA: hypothetical protein VHY37_00905 [Tepidisphaeraceae bacterium]|nr:hypothetical protein [Tepidisphaeraceae bacterium]
MTATLGPFPLERMMNAVEKVRLRLHKAATVLRAANVPYAVVGRNAVTLWVSRVDESAVRATRDVDVLLRRSDFDAARTALESAGFVYRHVTGIDVFLDSPQAKPHDAVHIIYANEKVRADEPIANPDVNESEDAGSYPVIGLEALVRIKLTANRDNHRTHLRDMIGVGLIDAS